MQKDNNHSSKPEHTKHRERMKTRILSFGTNTLADYELLESLLFYSIPRRDTKPIAKALLAKFKTFNAICQASPQELSEIDHIGEHSVVLFQIIHMIALRLGEEKIINKTTFLSWQDVISYCRTRIGFIEKEAFLVIFVDSKNSIIAADELASVTVDKVAVYPREIVKNALKYHATAIILVHNHPSGSTEPSKQDIAMTKHINQAIKTIDARLHDHLIISSEGHFSFKNAGLL
ncbi:MAG: RadC family protein [Candidatus Puniceispirillales bacterium]